MILQNSVIDRYRKDATFKNLVDLFMLHMQNAQFTPTEIREAAMLAQIMYEERILRPIMIEDVRRIIE